MVTERDARVLVCLYANTADCKSVHKGLPEITISRKPFRVRIFSLPLVLVKRRSASCFVCVVCMRSPLSLLLLLLGSSIDFPPLSVQRSGSGSWHNNPTKGARLVYAIPSGGGGGEKEY